MKKPSRIDRMIQELKALIEKARLAAKARIQKRRESRVPRKIYVPQFLHRRRSPSPLRLPSPRRLQSPRRRSVTRSQSVSRPVFIPARESPSAAAFSRSRSVAYRRPSASPLFAGTAVAIAPYVPSNQAPSATIRGPPKAKRSLFSIPENNNFKSPPATLGGASPKYVPAGGPPSTPRK
jgi:hypothetical protein